jgi:SSS family solute:Na+ symporter
MNLLDFVVLIGSMLGIAGFGIWRTRGRRNLNSYLKGEGRTPWFAIGLSVMATQASAITFLSTPGQGYLDGLGFVQIYFGVPIALILIAIFFLPIFRRLNVYTAYEYLGNRFDGKTRLLGAALFLLQRGLGAGLTIYAPAIVLTTVFGWPLNLTIICSGALVVIYTVMGGSDAVTVTQKYQIAIIFAGMAAAFGLAITKLPAGLTLGDTLEIAGHFQKLKAVNFSPDIHERYTFWSGLLGGTFLMLSYFGTDQSQVQRYISGSSLRESRLGLMFNAVCKIPMQFCILLLGVLLFVFYQFDQPPLFFNPAASHYLAQRAGRVSLAGVSDQSSGRTQTGQPIAAASDDVILNASETEFNKSHAEVSQHLQAWLSARHGGDEAAAQLALSAAAQAEAREEKIRQGANSALARTNPDIKANDADYVFITFILHELPHGVIGLLIAAFFAAALSSKAAELNALGSSTTIDFYRHLINRHATDARCVAATKWFTAFWGLVAIGFALFAHLAENLIQAVNILGSIFYGVMLGLFVVAFFIRRVGGTPVFWAALAAQTLVFILYHDLTISYLWYPLIGCTACVVFSLVLQAILGGGETVKRRAA